MLDNLERVGHQMRNRKFKNFYWSNKIYNRKFKNFDWSN